MRSRRKFAQGMTMASPERPIPGVNDLRMRTAPQDIARVTRFPELTPCCPLHSVCRLASTNFGSSLRWAAIRHLADSSSSDLSPRSAARVCGWQGLAQVFCAAPPDARGDVAWRSFTFRRLTGPLRYVRVWCLGTLSSVVTSVCRRLSVRGASPLAGLGRSDLACPTRLGLGCTHQAFR